MHGVVVALALCGALIGFAPFNRPVARIFLGDVGSLPIGLLFAWLLVLLAGSGHLAAAVILPLYYLADATLTLLRRMKDREPFWQAHRTHFYQLATDRGHQRARNRSPRVRHQSRIGRARHCDRAVARTADQRRSARYRRSAGRLAADPLYARQAVTRILVTGASGFVGRALVAELAGAGHSVRAAMRQPADVFPRSVEVVAVSDLTRPVEWRALLKDVETVVHLAGIAHAGAGRRRGRLRPGQSPRDRGARRRRARAIGIRHLVFISSIRAQSGPTSMHVLREIDVPQPTDAYGRSKLAAEDALRAAGLPFTILRPVLIYGSGVKGNLARLIEMAQSPWPLPLGLCRNRRSMLARENLIGAIHHVLAQPAARGETYIVADPKPLTPAEMVAALRAGAGRRPGLLPVPPALIALGARAMGRADEWQRVGGSQVADPGKLLQSGWKPTVETREGLAALTRAAEPR